MNTGPSFAPTRHADSQMTAYGSSIIARFFPDVVKVLSIRRRDKYPRILPKRRQATHSRMQSGFTGLLTLVLSTDIQSNPTCRCLKSGSLAGRQEATV